MKSTPVEIPVTVRRTIGTNAARQLRKAGLVPAVVYGRNRQPLPVTVAEEVFLHALPRGAWQTTPAKLRIEGGADAAPDQTPTVMVAAVQQNALTRKLYAIDFHVVSLQDRVHVQVPIRPIGESPGVKQGGMVQQLVHEIPIEARPGDLPDHLDVDISGLDLHEQVKVKDLVVSAEVKVLAPPDEIVLVIASPAKVEAEETVGPAEVEEPEVIQTRPQAEE